MQTTHGSPLKYKRFHGRCAVRSLGVNASAARCQANVSLLCFVFFQGNVEDLPVHVHPIVCFVQVLAGYSFWLRWGVDHFGMGVQYKLTLRTAFTVTVVVMVMGDGSASYVLCV